MTRPTRRNTRTWDRVIRMAHQAGFRAGMAAASGRKPKPFEEWYAEFNGTKPTEPQVALHIDQHVNRANTVVNASDLPPSVGAAMNSLHAEAHRILTARADQNRNQS